MTKTLHLTLKKKWFDMIVAALIPHAKIVKLEEYRQYKWFWIIRLLEPTRQMDDAEWYPFDMLREIEKHQSETYTQVDIMRLFETKFKHFDTITFRNGYGKNAPEMVIECKGIDIGPAVPEWSDNWQGCVFRIHLGKIIETKNIKP